MRSLNPVTYLSIMLSLLLVMSANLSKAQLSEKNYHIYSVKQNKEVDLNEIVNEMARYDVLLYGENHNDSVTHFIEKRLFQLLFDKFPKQLSLSMEMFDRDVQPVMDEYLAGFIKEKNLKKDGRVWTNYSDYRPLVEFAKEHKVDVVCANAAGRYSSLVGRSGMKALYDLPSVSKHNFAPLPFDTARGKYHDKIVALTTHTPDPPKPGDTAKASVAAPMPSMGNINFVLGQSLWDATMAYSIASYMKTHPGKKILQINGRVHCEEGYGIVPQLKKYKRDVKIMVISSFSDPGFDKIDWNQFKQYGDYVIITDPNVPPTYD